MKKGILGVRKDPKKQILFSFSTRSGDEWPSSDSNDADYEPDSIVEDSCETVPVERKRRKNKVKATANVEEKCSRSSSNILPAADNQTDIWGRRLPHVVLLKIFRYVVEATGAVPFLCRAQRVCRLWRECAGDSMLWKNVDLSYGWIKANDATLRALCQTHFTQLEHINLSNWKSLTAVGLKLMADSCPKLQSLNLSFCRVNSDGVLYIVDKCRQLMDINLSSYRNAIAVSGKMLIPIIEKCAANLRSLNLSRNDAKGYNLLFKSLAAKCPNLECLDLNQDSYRYIPLSFDVEQLQHGCQKLKILRLVNVNIDTVCASVNDKQNSPGFPELEELSLGTSSAQRSSNGDLFCRLTKTSCKLRLLDLRGWWQFQYHHLLNLPATDLQYLYLSSASFTNHDELQLAVAKWQHSLIELDLGWSVCPEAYLQMAIRNLSSNPSTSKLEVLDLRGTQVDVFGVKQLLDGCPRLRNLNLSSCRHLPRGLKREYTEESLMQLRKNLDSVTDSD